MRVVDDAKLQVLQKIIGVNFNNPNLLLQSLVHRSYLNENPHFHLEHNERLEFLGDAVLELAVTEYLYRLYPNPEGELTAWRAALVNSRMLAEKATQLGLDGYILLSRGGAKDFGKSRQYILANAFEALIGAIYLDQGFEKSSKFIEEKLLTELKHISENKTHRHPNSPFQARTHDQVGVTPSYEVLEEWGPDHSRHFIIGVFLNKELVAEGEGFSKQEAEIEAAKNALETKDW